MSMFVRSFRFLKSPTLDVNFVSRKQFGTEVSSHVSRKQTVSKHLILNEAQSRSLQFKNKADLPLVILYQWLGAKPTAVDKYCELYHHRGLDVLTVKGTLIQFLKPENGFDLAREILDYLGERRSHTNKNDSYIVHALSIGAFNHTLCLMTSRDVDKYNWFSKSIRGSVFDSIVIGSLENMTNGMSISITKSKLIQSAIRLLCMSYFSLQKDQTIKFYDSAVDFFRNNPVISPTQYFYSHDDPMCDTETLKELIGYWRKVFPDIELYENSWLKSAHAAHIKFHKEEYKSAMNRYFKIHGL